ncbi:3,4-dihydroxy-2-butanone-4-phosphate synthase [Sphingobium sp. B2]|uniref:3,4-dihydroxy-2-butanone-4-phosphate synthase n=1 Tax=Sphingobium sp. B2 TaxID=2583228 RepID=UPI00119D4E9E|nr:3,4-dihydroxy-2-butanone-4-phosphate synthase [Sphingobium sp. B2]
MDNPLTSIETILAESRAGRIVVLIDDERSVGMGMAIMPASFVTAEKITFLAVHCRGVICLALAPERVAQLNLTPMVAQNGSARQSAFTVSIEARTGVTTGISAADRARTIEVAIDPHMGASEVVSPGHIFPVASRDGGVLVRAGFSEAAVDLARLAGLNPSGVLAAILGEDGDVASADQLIEFANAHHLKIGTIRDLIAYRRATEILVERVSSETIDSAHGGLWRTHVYRNRTDGTEHIALVKEGYDKRGPVLVRMHTFLAQDDVLARKGSRRKLIPSAMDAIAEAGAGIVVLIRGSILLHEQPSAPQTTLREFGIGAQILRDLEVTQIELLSNTLELPLAGISAYDLEVVGIRRLGT